MTISNTQKRDLHQRTLVEEGGSWPMGEELRFVMDLATIEHVDIKTKQVFARPWHLNGNPIPCQWSSPLFDPVTGHGLHVMPKPGMHGLIALINEHAVFLTFTGLKDEDDVTGFSDDREEIDFGAGAFRTSQETKQIWSPNFHLLQAANLCKIILTRAKKSIDTTFFNLNGLSLGGTFKWLADPTGERAVELGWEIRNKVKPGRDSKGNLKKDDATIATFDGGSSEGGKRMLGMNISRVQPKVKETQISTDLKAFGSALEDLPLQAFRALLLDRMQQNKVNSFKEFEKNDKEFFDLVHPAPRALGAQAGSLTGGTIFINDTEHPTVDLIVEALVAAAGFVDTGNAQVILKPALDGGATDSAGFAVPQDPLERVEDELNAKKDEGAEPTTIVHDMLKKARKVQDVKDEPKITQKLDVGFAENGDIVGVQEEGLSWELEKILKIVSHKGNFNFDAGEGMIVRAKRGHVILGNKACGISFGLDGTIKLIGTSIEMMPMEREGDDELVVSNKGTAFRLTPQGVIMTSGGEMVLQAKGKITEKPGVPPEPVVKAVKDVRDELVKMAKIPGIEE